ncbi:AraC family transcriptional regulator [Pseudomonas chlororaphis]|uniref:helix-turn-helix domain-containing protein n=1 Tax=Pseudomonas chlororaphis TaxID=587753 RepID=UPI00209B30D6|nr:AraC family transcriptional regulator [Pseudomonas chlororaphis]MCO7573458.1 AraC family transcriptional regulator [Pseudomonas chlororaphis]MCO7591331.1 AraC family transcriptional regulator [Pseudomonas chlororaphis]
MSPCALLETRHASTQAVELDQRLRFWEDYNASTLVGLKCNSYAESGFRARQDNLQLSAMRLACIVGNQHVVERDSSMIRGVPKESIFVSLVSGSGSFFYQDGACQVLEPGELVVYRTDKPYLFGFSGAMRQFIFDIPQVQFAERCLKRFDRPLKIGVQSGVQRLLLRTLGERTRAFFQQPLCVEAEAYQEQAFELLASLIAGQVGERPINALSGAYLLAAKQCIQEQLADPSLSCERVAAQTGISPRHLARLFALEGTLPSRFILEKRLHLARQLLGSRQGAGLDISEIAYRHGFASQAHFARAFKARYQLTPSEARARKSS